MTDRLPLHASPLLTRLNPPVATSARRTWLGVALLGLVTARSAQAQMGGGGGRGKEGGGPGAAKCASTASATETATSPTLVRMDAGERLQSLPGELQLRPEQLPLYERYRQSVERIMLDESRWAARAPAQSMNTLLSVGAQIDLASHRAAAWEDVLAAVKPLYASMDKAQQAVADRRLVVSLEPSAWARPGGPKGQPEGDEAGGPPAGGPPGR